MSKPYLSIVIPAYNEAKRLPETLKKVRAFLENQTYTSEVYVVNDGATDETAQVVSELINSSAGGWSNFRLISYAKNQGKGYAVKTGMMAAEGEWRLMMDSDNSTDISQLDKFWEFTQPNPKFESLNSKQIQNLKFEIQNYYEVIIGSRYLDKDSIKIKQPLSRRLVSRTGNWLIRTMLGIKSVDTQCGFKLFSAAAAMKIFPKQTINRWSFDVEILAIAIKLGYQIKEVPVDWFAAEGSQVKKMAVFGTLKEIWQIRKNLTKNKY